MTSKLWCIGGSSKGPQHLKTGKPNQDSYMIRDLIKGKVAVVADGVGSAVNARLGSKAICEAVCEGCKLWSEYPDADIKLLFKVIMNLWNLKISPHPKTNCGTTCLFVYYGYDGKTVMAQIGDGIIAYNIGEEFKIFYEKEEAFSNMTSSVSRAKNIKDWKYQEFRVKPEEDFSFLICTDGVSEDLIGDKREEFKDYLIDKCKNTKLNRQEKEINRLLKKWPTPKHGDDKTIVLFEKQVKKTVR